MGSYESGTGGWIGFVPETGLAQETELSSLHRVIPDPVVIPTAHSEPVPPIEQESPGPAPSMVNVFRRGVAVRVSATLPP